MTPEISEWCSDIASMYKKENPKVLDIGSLDINGNIRSVIQNADYVGIDLEDGKNVDIVMTSHYISEEFEADSFDIVCCFSMLNSDPNFWITLGNIKRVLKDDGLLLISVPAFNFLNHENYPNDYYRFTIDTFKDVFFNDMEILDIQNFHNGGMTTIAGAASKSKKKNYKTNLIYYIAPFEGEMWKWNVKQISRFRSSFNNKKIVFIATDDRFISPEIVKYEFDQINGFKDIIFETIPNNAQLGECAALYKMFDMVFSLDENEYTFFAHGKGVTREKERKKGWCSLSANKTWTTKMLAYNLSSTDKIHRILSDSPCFGIMKSTFEKRKLGWYFKYSKNMWIYAGGFFWFNNANLFSEDYKSVKLETRYTIESYLSNFFTYEQAGSELSGMGDVVNYSNSPFRENSWTRWSDEGHV